MNKETHRKRRTALLLGATGLVGEHCLQILLDDTAYERVRVLTRRPISIQNSKLTQHVIDFDRLAQNEQLLQADDIYCCLGTTIKKARTKENFKKVDHDYPLEAAKLSLKYGAKQFLLVSSTGANERSSFFYARIKGELEQALERFRFALSCFSVHPCC